MSHSHLWQEKTRVFPFLESPREMTTWSCLPFQLLPIDEVKMGSHHLAVPHCAGKTGLSQPVDVLPVHLILCEPQNNGKPEGKAGPSLPCPSEYRKAAGLCGVGKAVLSCILTARQNWTGGQRPPQPEAPNSFKFKAFVHL